MCLIKNAFVRFWPATDKWQYLFFCVLIFYLQVYKNFLYVSTDTSGKCISTKNLNLQFFKVAPPYGPIYLVLITKQTIHSQKILTMQQGESYYFSIQSNPCTLHQKNQDKASAPWQLSLNKTSLVLGEVSQNLGQTPPIKSC